jgi:tetratricopeptide (TPR) repeat protein
MEPDRAQVAQQFAHDLRRLHQRAGRPSYSTLERVSKHELKRATVSDILNGNRVNLPDWGFVATFVESCGQAAAEGKLDARELPALTEWKRHWDEAFNLISQSRFDQAGLADWTRYWDVVFSETVIIQLPAAGPRPPNLPGPHVVPPPSLPAPHVVPTASEAGSRAVPAAEAPPLVAEATAPSAGGGPLPSRWGQVPARLADFVGREDWLSRVREALISPARDHMVVIQGLCGIGKTQLAATYAYRYASEYDLVWWIPCWDLAAAQEAMDGLQAALSRPDEEPAEAADGRYARLLRALRAGRPCERWLLVFDNANEPDEIRDLLPQAAGGHVLLTSRDSSWEGTVDMLELDVFSRAESIEFQRRRMRKFSDAAAHQLADVVGDLPLLLEHAVESQLVVAQYKSRLESDPLDLLDGQPCDYHATIAGEWRSSLAQLRDRAPDSLELLHCLCFFGGGAIARESLERGNYYPPDISINGVLRDPKRLRGAISMLRRAGLVRVRATDQALEVHQVTRTLVRAVLEETGPAGESRPRHDAHLMLAAIDPRDPEDPANWVAYGDLLDHAVASGAHACRDEPVRKLVVNLTRFLTESGDPRAALSLADQVLEHWTADAAGAPARGTDHRVAMLHAKAGALLACGRRSEAFQLQEDVLAMMRSAPGDRWEAEVIMLNRMVGAQWRALGNFREAQLADLESVNAHVLKFASANSQTFLAVNELIADLALNGDYAEASRHARRLCGECLIFYDKDASHLAVLFQRNVLGRCLWLSGRYAEALAIFADTSDKYQKAVAGGIVDWSHPWCLVHELDYAVARRDHSAAAADLDALAGHLHEVRRRCWRGLGADHPLTLAATVILASVTRRISGRPAEAARLIADASRRYAATLPGHPYRLACRAYLGAVRGSTSPGRPDPDLASVVEQLAAEVGSTHPLALTAVAGLVTALADAGELEAALAWGQRALDGFRDRLGADHPHALASEANLVTIRARLGNEPDRGLRDIDFTPLPLLGKVAYSLMRLRCGTIIGGRRQRSRRTPGRRQCQLFGQMTLTFTMRSPARASRSSSSHTWRLTRPATRSR